MSLAVALVFFTVLVFIAIVPIIMTVFMMLLAGMVTSLIARDVFTLVPAILHKVDAFAAGVVLAAMLAPVFGMSGRYMQINGIARHRHRINHDRLAVYQLRTPEIANIDTSVIAGLSEIDIDVDIGR